MLKKRGVLKDVEGEFVLFVLFSFFFFFDADCLLIMKRKMKATMTNLL